MQLKEAELHYLTKKSFCSILENNPYLDKIHSIDEDLSEVMDVLKKEKFDCIIDLHHNLRTLQVKRKLNRPSFSFRKLNIEKWLLVNLKINRLPPVHIVDRYFETVKNFGVTNDGMGLDYFIPEKDKINIAALPETHRQGYTGFVIGAAHATKRLPLNKIISICKKINSPIILLGGKDDVENGREIEATVGSTVYNACGKYNLNQSASLVNQANKVITHDTGLMHIAAAFQKPIISVWGNTVPEFGMYPYYTEKHKVQSAKIEVKNLPCRPCSKIGFEECPKGHFKCMKEINEAELISKIKPSAL